MARVDKSTSRRPDQGSQACGHRAGSGITRYVALGDAVKPDGASFADLSSSGVVEPSAGLVGDGRLSRAAAIRGLRSSKGKREPARHQVDTPSGRAVVKSFQPDLWRTA